VIATQKVATITEIKGAIADTQNNFGYFFPWKVSTKSQLHRM
jgi:hypothetical protein